MKRAETESESTQEKDKDKDKDKSIYQKIHLFKRCIFCITAKTKPHRFSEKKTALRR
jgi:hypothetical protein